MGDAGVTGDAGVPQGGPLAGAFVYAVIPRCPNLPGYGQFEGVTLAVSHELIEASTDPFFDTSPAYQLVDDDHAAWNFGLTPQPLAEVGDLCHYEQTSASLHNFAVERGWSNRAAAAELDPCVPAGPDPYFGAAPDLSERVVLGDLSTLGVRIPVGRSKTVDVRLFSNAPMQDWHVVAVEGPVLGPARSLQFQWDRETGNNGDVLKLTITRTSDGPLGGASVVVVYSSVDAFGGFTGNAWPGFVAN